MSKHLFTIFFLFSASLPGAFADDSNDLSEKWTYSGDFGPANWNRLSPDYKICRIGRNQSPINIMRGYADTRYQILPQISEHYLILENTGKALKLSYENDSILEALGETYTLEEIIFHTDSEHQLDGHTKPLEIQFVHKDKQGNIAIFSILFDEGEENSFLKIIERYYPEQADGKHVYQDVKLNAKALLPINKSYAYYRGSLTTPPCTEAVNWFIFTNPATASEEQINKLKTLIGSNNRPLQLLNARALIHSEK